MITSKEALRNLHLHIEAIANSKMDAFYKCDAIASAVADFDEDYVKDGVFRSVTLTDKEFMQEGRTHTQEDYLELMLERFKKHYTIE